MDDLADRVAELEREVRALRRRVMILLSVGAGVGTLALACRAAPNASAEPSGGRIIQLVDGNQRLAIDASGITIQRGDRTMQISASALQATTPDGHAQLGANTLNLTSAERPERAAILLTVEPDGANLSMLSGRARLGAFAGKTTAQLKLDGVRLRDDSKSAVELSASDVGAVSTTHTDRNAALVAGDSACWKLAGNLEGKTQICKE